MAVWHQEDMFVYHDYWEAHPEVTYETWRLLVEIARSRNQIMRTDCIQVSEKDMLIFQYCVKAFVLWIAKFNIYTFPLTVTSLRGIVLWWRSLKFETADEYTRKPGVQELRIYDTDLHSVLLLCCKITQEHWQTQQIS